ncbi:MAG: AI-2E family transporter [Parcubacteria group bacterium]|jgi:predicted PurR-regulated permease PerM
MLSRQTIDISTGIIFRTVLILIGLWFVYFVRDILALLFIAIILVAAMDPIVYRLHRRKIPRTVGVSIVYSCMFAVVGLIVSFLVPPLVAQFQDFSQRLPSIASSLENSFQGINTFFQAQHIALTTQELLTEISSQLATSTADIFSATVGVFSGFVSAIIVLVMAFYMASKDDGIKNFVVSITPDQHKQYAGSLVLRIQRKIGRWMLGQMLLMFIIFALDFAGLYLLDVPYALTLAIFAGLMEVVPYIGPIVSAVPAILVGLSVSPLTGLLVAIVYVVVQQFEGHIIIPQVMRKAVGLHPIAVILALLVGLKLGGVLGAILAIPIATAISVFVGDLFEKAKEG